MKSPPSLLDVIEIASPCSADWDAMTGDDRKRFCGDCKLHVYNISEMTRAEAEELISTHEGRLCGRLYRRNDGTVITRDCPVGLRAVRRRLARSLAAVATVLGFLTFGTVYARGNSVSVPRTASFFFPPDRRSFGHRNPGGVPWSSRAERGGGGNGIGSGRRFGGGRWRGRTGAV